MGRINSEKKKKDGDRITCFEQYNTSEGMNIVRKKVKKQKNRLS